MKTYLVLAFVDPSKKIENEGSMEDWMQWSEGNADNIEDMGAPLSGGVEGSSNEGFNVIKEDMWPAQGYMMLKAESMEKVQELVKASPLSNDMPIRIFEKADMG